jgi:hypothetical protein
VYCNQCGHRNPETANFCSSCGAVLEHPGETEPKTITLAPVDGDAEEDVVVHMGDLPPDAGVLVVKRGPNAGSRFVLEPGTTRVGRHPQSDIFLDDVTVSRRHAEVLALPGHYEVSDVGSLNGTYLNRERIERATLGHGDELQVGKFRLVFLTESTGA